MKIAVSAAGPELDSQVDPRFGRCPWFVIAEAQGEGFEALRNPGLEAAQGAGIAAAQLVADRGAGCVITGHCGPKAWRALEAAKVVVIGEAGGLSVRQALERYRSGGFQPLEGPTAAGGGF
jgi:predicted Fe-Mo cluster-binding NifX family protein